MGGEYGNIYANEAGLDKNRHGREDTLVGKNYSDKICVWSVEIQGCILSDVSWMQVDLICVFVKLAIKLFQTCPRGDRERETHCRVFESECNMKSEPLIFVSGIF